MRRLAIPVVALLLTGLAGCTLKEDKKSGDESKKSSDKQIRRVGFGGIFAGDVDDLANGGRRRKRNQRPPNNQQANNPQAQNRAN
ncbi:MAG: hypothetical protein IID45_06450, partial [Planctomycetes bacterium]|nr:hypothetical protein [Planctomycetota bacterium]